MQDIPQIVRITNIPEMDEPIFFHLKSGEQEFTISFTDVMACVKYAQDEKFIRHVQDDYWNQIDKFCPGILNRIGDSVTEDIFPLGVVDGDGDEYMYFPLQINDYKFTIGLSHILMCLKLAEEEGDAPLLSKKSWHELEKFYRELEEMRVFGFDEEI